MQGQPDLISYEQWRSQVREDALEPDLPIVDPHHHIWDAAPLPGIESYGTEAFFADKIGSGHNIIGTVSVDCRTNYRPDGPERYRIIGETEFIDSVAQEAERRGGRYAGACAAIVPTAVLTEGSAVGEILDAHLEASPRVRGIRFMTAFAEGLPAPPGRTAEMMRRSDFREGFAELIKRDLSYDAWVFQTQMHEVAELARAFPNARIILDQLGGPFVGGRYEGDKQASFAEWKSAICAVAACDNVVLKIGGLNMHYAGVDAGGLDKPRTSAETADAQRDYILWSIDAFGPTRCMFVTNFPVDMKSISYTMLWNSFKRVTAGFSADERAAMFSGVAMDTYRISQIAMQVA